MDGKAIEIMDCSPNFLGMKICNFYILK